MKQIIWFLLEPNSHVQFPFGGAEIRASPFLILLALWAYVASIIWMSRDARKRGMRGILAGIFAALGMWPLSLLLWLWLRPAKLSSRYGSPA
jgi:hypothetical protein